LVTGSLLALSRLTSSSEADPLVGVLPDVAGVIDRRVDGNELLAGHPRIDTLVGRFTGPPIVAKAADETAAAHDVAAAEIVILQE
jgi:hypothetical protein